MHVIINLPINCNIWMNKDFTNCVVFFLAKSIAIAFLLLLPDFIFAVVDHSFTISSDIRSLLLIYLLGACFALSPHKIFAAIVISILGILQIAQFSHISCFVTQLSPFAIYLLTKESLEVLEDSILMFFDYWYLLPMVAIPYFAAFYVTIKWSFKRKIIGTISLSTFFITSFVVLAVTRVPRFDPNEARFTLFNSVNSFLSYWIIACKHYTIKDYKPYVVKQIKKINEPVTIVYILGESCNMNHMSLYGYNIETTPQLKTFAQNNQNFYYTKGIAGAIATFPSSKFMLNVIGEPDNVKMTSQDVTNLFKIAKMAGFRTFYISAQRCNLLAVLGGAAFIDVMVTHDDYPMRFFNQQDEFLLEFVEKMQKEGKFSDKNFIVLHQKCVHAPFGRIGKDCKLAPKIRLTHSDKRIENYDNSMLHNDAIITSIFKFFNQVQHKFYIFFASDHNELLGENGLWGHGSGKLVIEVAQIPIFLQTNDEEFLKTFKTISPLTHYEIAKKIAGLLGFSIVNPNEQDGVFYTDGVDHNGTLGYIKYTKQNGKIEHSVVVP